VSLEVDVHVRRDGFVVKADMRAGLGETVAVLGPNGAGKSTLVECLAGLLPPATGRVTLDGEVLDEPGRRMHRPPERRSIGVVFQGLRLFPHLSAVENVAFPLRARGLSGRQARRRAMESMERLGVAGRADARPGALSGGEAQRVALARALVFRPRLLLLDEPLSALDVLARGQIRSLVGSLLAGFEGVRLLVTHDPVDAMTMADRLIVLEWGLITQVGTPEEIRQAPRTRYAAELVGVNLFFGRLRPLEEGAAALASAEGEIVVGRPERLEREVEGAIGLLRPVDVAIHLARPEGGSARNLVEGPITSLTLEGDRARIRVGSAPPVVAEVTLGSVARLGLREGVRVWASFKAVEVEVLLP
jgi:molybdate transport system ATP-binding protein